MGDGVAQRVEVVLIDDLNGERADETVRFSLDGSSYEIDLTEAHANALRDSIKDFVTNARKASTHSRKRAAARR